MFAELTINDYQNWVRWHLKKALTNAEGAVGQIRAEHAARGILDSSMTVMRVIGDVKKEFDAGVEAALGELHRAVSKTNLDPQELRQATAQCLVNFANATKRVAAPYLSGRGDRSDDEDRHAPRRITPQRLAVDRRGGGKAECQVGDAE
jgi:hypothetical protein